MSTNNKDISRETLSSRLGFILVVAGCAIGLGNVWRFPYITGQNGGAIFVIIFLICLLLLGVPCLLTELAIGRAARKSVVEAIDVLEPGKSKWHLAKFAMFMGPYVLLSFYTVVTGWLIYYLGSFLTADFENIRLLNDKALISEALKDKFGGLLSDPVTMISYTLGVILLSAIVCIGGVKNSIERVTKPMMMALLVLLIALAGYSLSLDGAQEGFSYYLSPDVSKIEKVGLINVIFQALNQALFTLGIGIGSILIFASYQNKQRSLISESLVIVSLDTFVAILAGLVIFPSCISYNVPVDAGPTLLFQSMLNVFANMSAGRYVGGFFFLFLSFAAFTTVVAVMEEIVANSMELFKWTRKKSCIINFISMGLLSLPCALGFNLWSDFHPFGPNSGVLDLEDFIISNNLLPLGALFFVLFCSWGWGYKNFEKELNTGLGIKAPKWFEYYLKFVLPFLILIIFVLGYLDFLGIYKI